MESLNKDIERILMNMKYDSRKTLYENKKLLSEDGPTPLTFDAPSPSNLSNIAKWTTVGKILSKVSNNLPNLEEIIYDENIMVIKGKKYLQYDEGTMVTNYKPAVTNCITERYSNGRAKSWDKACYEKYNKNLESLQKQRHTFCLSRILNNQGLLNMPFAIQVSGTKMDQYGESKDGIYKVFFFLSGENCTFNGFNYFYESGYETFLNYDYPLKPIKGQSISKPKEKLKQVIKQIERKTETPKLTPEQQKKWCADHGKVWSDEVNACVGKEITLDSSKMEIKPKEKEKEKDVPGGLGSKGVEGKGVEINSTSGDSKSKNDTFSLELN